MRMRCTSRRFRRQLPQPRQLQPACGNRHRAGASARIAAERTAPASEKPPAARPHFSRQPARSRDRKPRRAPRAAAWPGLPAATRRATSARSAGARTNGSSRHAPAARWAHGTAKSANGKHNGTHAGKASASGGRFNGNGHARTARPANGASSLRKTKPPRRGACAAATPPPGKPRRNLRQARPGRASSSGPAFPEKKRALMCAARAAAASRLWQPPQKQATERGTALPLRQDRERRNADERGRKPHSFS